MDKIKFTPITGGSNGGHLSVQFSHLHAVLGKNLVNSMFSPKLRGWEILDPPLPIPGGDLKLFSEKRLPLFLYMDVGLQKWFSIFKNKINPFRKTSSSLNKT